MTLSDADIRALLTDDETSLISNYDISKLRNCRYNLRAGRAFLPETGKEQIIGQSEPQSISIRFDRFVRRTKRTVTSVFKQQVPPLHAEETRSIAWCIKPSESIVIMTEEAVSLPPNLYATYDQLHRLAQQGLLLINSSIVEPGYRGPLSCYIVNFSRRDVFIYPSDAVAKISFHELKQEPEHLHPDIIDPDSYVKFLCDSASSFPTSFMDISNLEAKVAQRIEKTMDTRIKWVGVGLGVLLLVSSFEPFLSRHIYESIGILPRTARDETLKTQYDLANAKAELEKAQLRSELLRIQAELAETRSDLERAKSKTDAAPD